MRPHAVVTTVTEWFWDFTTDYKIYAYAGELHVEPPRGPDETVILLHPPPYVCQMFQSG